MAIFPFLFTVWISVLYERSFQILLLKNFKDLHMFFKELACFILFSYQCSSTALIYFIRDSFYILSCVTFFVNNFFQLFLTLFSLFQRRLLKLVFILLICCCRVQQPWILYTLVSTKVNNIFQTFSKMAFWLIRTIYALVFVRFAHFQTSIQNSTPFI